MKASKVKRRKLRKAIKKWESKAGWQESVRMQSKKEESEEYGGEVRECRARRRTKLWEESKLGK